MSRNSLTLAGAGAGAPAARGCHRAGRDRWSGASPRCFPIPTPRHRVHAGLDEEL